MHRMLSIKTANIEREIFSGAIAARLRSFHIRLALLFILTIQFILFANHASIAIAAFAWFFVAGILQFIERNIGRHIMLSGFVDDDKKCRIFYAVVFITTCAMALPYLAVWYLSPENGKLIVALLFGGTLLHIVVTLNAHPKLFWAALLPHFIGMIGLGAANLLINVSWNEMISNIIAFTTIIIVCAFALLCAHYLNRRTLLMVERRQRTAQDRLQAQAANRAKSEFVAMTSHELRTLMNAMMGAVELLRRTDLSLTQREHLETLAEGGNMLLSLLNDILDMSKIESGNLETENIPVDLQHLIHGLEVMWQPRARDKGLELHIDIAENTPHAIMTDPIRLRQILFNLLSNAVKFTETGRIELSVRTQSGQDDATMITFEVNDTGCGIDPAAHKRIFTPFQQADISTARHFGGTGLGLSISRGLANLMGGNLDIESTSSKGSCFTLSLPLFLSAAPDAMEAADIDMEMPSGDRLNVMIVEDHPANRRVLGALLQPYNFDIIMAKDGIQALELFEIADFDVILMDVQMPNMDGYETTQQIRQLDEKGRNIPIIALTANAGESDKNKCLEAGMTDFVSKPIDPQVLHMAILKAAERRGGDSLSAA